MMGVAAYESYKDSGEGWIEDVPAHWEIRKLKHLFQEKKHRQNLDLNCGSISFGEVVEKDDERVPLATKASYQEVSKGEFLVNPLNLNYDLKSLRIGLSDIDVVVSAGYLVLQAKDEMDKRYFKYLLHRYDVAYMKLLGSGVRQTISFNHIANSILVAPPLPEQRAIAAFLDDKCAKIDGAVKIKEDQIALLRERRQIIIQEAVTRGLNPAAPMKDSGIDWIGQIPAHWEVKRFKHFFSTAMGETILGENLIEDGKIPVYSATEGDHFFGYVNKSRVNLSAGDLVIPARGNSIGFPKLVAGPATCSQTTIYAKKLRSISSEFVFFYLLSCKRFLFQFVQTAIPQITVDEVKNNILLLPPPPEQAELVEYCEDITQRFDSAIEIKRRQIDALNEYKTSLINAAVTGKIKVI